MKLKKVKNIGFVIFVVSLAVFAIGLLIDFVPLMVLGGAIYILFIFFLLTNSKCPHCGSYIKNGDWKHCPNCGKDLKR